jgi:6-phosphogluconolactonase
MTHADPGVGWRPPSGTTPILVGSYAGADEPGIHVVLLDGDRRARMIGSITGVTNPSYLLWHPDGRHLYAVSETGLASDGRHGSVEAFRLDQGPGEGPIVTHLGGRSTGGDHPCHLAIDPTGRWIVASNYGTGDFSVHPIDGEVFDRVAGAAHTGSGPNRGRQEGPHAHASAFTPDGRLLLVADLGIDRVIGYSFDDETGAVERRFEVDTGPGTGPRHLAFHPDGEHLFVVNELSNTVAVFRRTGEGFEAFGTTTTLPDGTTTNQAAGLRVSSDGSRVYVSNRGHDSIAVLAFSASTGLELTAVGSCGGAWPRDFAVLGDLACLVVGNRHDDELVLISLDSDGGAIGSVLQRFELREPSCVLVG